MTGSGRQGRFTTRAQAGLSLAGMGLALVVLSAAMVLPGVPAAYALDDPENSDKELICHNLVGLTSPSDGISVNKSSLGAHPDAGHIYDIVEGQYSDSLGRIAVAADIATISSTIVVDPKKGTVSTVYTITYLCGNSQATTTTTSTSTTTTSTSTTTTSTSTTTTSTSTTTTSTSTTTTSTSTTTTTTTLPPTTTTTTTTLPPTTTTTTTTLPPTTTTTSTTTTTTLPPTTTTTIGGPTTTTTLGTTTSVTKPDGATTTIGGGSTTTTIIGGGSTTTTSIGGPCNPADPDCLPNTGAGRLVWVLLAGLGLLFLGVGTLMVADEKRRMQVA